MVRVLERSFSYPVIKRRLESLWARNGHIQVSDMSNAIFLVRFSDGGGGGGDYQRAAFGGPWKIFDYYITVARWTTSFNEKAPIQKILTWVRLPKLPIHYFNPTAVERIRNHIGRTIKLDLATAEGAWARYARVCVEVDLSKPLLGKYMVDDRIMYIEYESLDKICYSCGMYGHKLDSCPLNSPHDTDIPTETEPEPLPEKEVEGDSGSWMTVTRRIKKNSKQPIGTPKEAVGSRSRFSVLSQDKAPAASSQGAPTSKEQPKQNSAPSSVFSGHADRLSRVLKAVMGQESTTNKQSTKPPASPRKALQVIPNSELNAQVLGNPDQQPSNLVSVPVTLVMSDFKTATSASTPPLKSKGKGKLKENRAPPQAK
ncbi:hypothetical protein LINPERHAP2_LOCUS24578 [Linum perenne]